MALSKKAIDELREKQTAPNKGATTSVAALSKAEKSIREMLSDYGILSETEMVITSLPANRQVKQETLVVSYPSSPEMKNVNRFSLCEIQIYANQPFILRYFDYIVDRIRSITGLKHLQETLESAKASVVSQGFAPEKAGKFFILTHHPAVSSTYTEKQIFETLDINMSSQKIADLVSHGLSPQEIRDAEGIPESWLNKLLE
jgi:hypothetical protein